MNKNISDSFFAFDLPDSIIKRLSLRIKETDGINLGQGIPSFATPDHIIAAVKRDLDDVGIGVYPNFLGTAELRASLVKKIFDVHSIRLSEEQNILITVGAMEATSSAILSLVKTGDTVGVITPDYCNHFPQIALARGKLVEIPLIESSNWMIDLTRVEQEMKQGMKLLILTNPSNPTGSVINNETLTKLIQIAKQYGTWILFDETYSFLTFSTDFISGLEYWNDYDRIITVRSFSKEYAMTGWRVGYVIANDMALNAISRTHDALVGCASKISQRAALAAINGPQSCVTFFRDTLRHRRDIACEILNTIPSLSYIIPNGTYYVFPKYNVPISSIELCNRIIEHANVAVVPGVAFGDAGEGHFRISFAVEDSLLNEGLKRIANFFNDFKAKL